jgi:IclR family acetate operon transcriptional repressor
VTNDFAATAPSPASDVAAHSYAIESVENAAKTLLMLRDRPSIRAIDVSTELGVARSTAHRMVTTLARAGLLRRGASDKSYTAGYALVELGMAVIGTADLRAEIAPVLTHLAATTGETTHFLIREQDEVVFVSVAEGSHIIRASSRVGSRLPAHVTSAGKCLLAALSEDQLSALYPARRRLAGGTDGAIRTRKRLFEEIEEVAARGWAVNRSESEPGLVAVSAAVHDARGTALGAISVSGPADRIEPRIAHIVAAMQAAIADLERDLSRRTNP